MMRTIDTNFRAQLAGYSLTTAEILYRLPDHPALLQTFIWQEYDVHPRFPRLLGFLTLAAPPRRQVTASPSPIAS